VTAPHFFVDGLADAEPGAILDLSPQDSRHALRSLRLRPGEDVTLADGSGRFARGRMLAPRTGSRERLQLAPVEVLEVETLPPPSPTVIVAMAPPKGDRLAWAVQKLAEIGVDQLDLLHDAERAVRAVEADAGHALFDRMRTIAREAAMQSRRPSVMEVMPAAFDEELQRSQPRRVVLVLWEGATRSLRDALAEVPASDEIRLVVGPEGSFSQAEMDRVRVAGVEPVSLGRGILRTETAAVAGAVLALGAFGRLG
jgi:16S rRNA (uracil1498-N3)-methyltransferase